MDEHIIRQLNEVNQKFYKKSARDFSDSRAFYWHGWREILPYLENMLGEKETLRVLDVGCGNGRFGSFLVDNLPSIEIQYTGMDNNDTLLTIAQHKLKHTHLDTTFIKTDIVEDLLSDQFFKDTKEKYDIIVLFGVLHHIPSYKLRKKLITTLSKLVSDNGLFVFTLWRFADDDQLEKRLVGYDKAGINEKDIDSNDYLISWERETTSFRYGHYTDESEEDKLITASGLHLLESFESDGREGRGNKYLVLSQPGSV